MDGHTYLARDLRTYVKDGRTHVYLFLARYMWTDVQVGQIYVRVGSTRGSMNRPTSYWSIVQSEAKPVRPTTMTNYNNHRSNVNNDQ